MRIVVALGGNALGKTPEEQKERVQHAAHALCDMLEQGHSLILTHGNGPQVGSIQLAFDAAHKSGASLPDMPLPECTAMSQGYIGWHLQNAMQARLRACKKQTPVATIVTQVEVSAEDPAFANPTKPIGSFYDESEAKRQAALHAGWVFREDAGRGYRRVVPSPNPLRIVERDSIRALVDAGAVVIACGGGGVPVVQGAGGSLESVPAVIDKDFAAARLAQAVEADRLVILTAVDRVRLDFGKPEEQAIAAMSIEQAERHCREGQFAVGSMLPKVQACVQFAKAGGTALIAGLEQAAAALEGKSGTIISPASAVLGDVGAAAFMP